MSYRIGIIGFAHMHINSLVQQFDAHPQTEWVACADTVPLRSETSQARYTRAWNRRNAEENFGITKGYDDYQELLAQEKLDIVICCSENAQHPDVVEACAAAGVHVVVEKPMAMSLTHGLRMVRAAQNAGTTLLINWPMAWSTASRTAKALLDAGEIGRILEVKFRGGHLGPLGRGVSHPGVTEGADAMTGADRGSTWWHQTEPGGGAMIDYCGYGSLAARWFIGMPALAAIGMRANLDSPWGDADDNGAMIVRFPAAMALFEASWTTHDHGVPVGPIVYGTDGTMVIERKGEEQVRIERGGGQTEIRACEALPEGRQTIAEEFIHHLETGEDVHPTLHPVFNLDVMAILDAGVRSADSGKLETVDNSVWRIG